MLWYVFWFGVSYLIGRVARRVVLSRRGKALSFALFVPSYILAVFVDSLLTHDPPGVYVVPCLLDMVVMGAGYAVGLIGYGV